MKKTTVNSSLGSMYDNYYNDNDRTLLKRKLTALETIEHIQSIWDVSKSKKILDVGAGEGSLLECLSKLNCDHQLYGVEISTSGIEVINSKNISNLVEVLQFDGYKIPYPDKYFDLAICIHVLEHVEHERLFINELKRVATRIIIEVPLEHTFRVKRSIQIGKLYGHINFYTPDTFSNIVTTCSLKITELRILTFSHQYESLLSGRFIGLLKHIFRSTLLKFLPGASPNLIVYFCILLCEDSETIY
jgi:ubiquinone/menaquinone biosynthesis C-methylase UbiE